MPENYEVRLESPARRAMAERLPMTVAVAANNFIFGVLAKNPQRVGKPLDPPLAPSWSARRGEYRVIYTIDDQRRRIRIQDIRHRRDAYRVK